MANFRCHLILLLAVWCCAAKAAKIGRDIILVPNEVQQVPGKAMLYEPKPNAFEQLRNRVWNNSVDDISEENDEPLWLGPLKHALFLMLSNKVNGTESDAIAEKEKAFQQAEFIGLRGAIETNSKFGDVINLANGKIELDRDLNARIVEQVQNCMNRCWNEVTDGDNTTAFWSVYKVRHRDDKRQFRYEWKIMIRKLKISRKDNRRNVDDSDHSIVRSFILRDDDYPKYFTSKTAIDGHGNVPRMEKRIFTTGYDRINVPFKLDKQINAKLISSRNGYYDQNGNLNTGEYYAANVGFVSKPSDPVEYFQRPAESPQFVAQDNQQQQQQQHHYFLNNDHNSAREEALLFKAPQYEKVTAYPVSASYPSPIQHSTQIQNPIRSNGLYRDSYASLQSNGPLQFPEEYNRIRFDSIGQTKFKGPYDDNRESILDEEPQHAYHNQHVNVNGHSNFRFPSDNVRDIGSLNTPRPYQSSFNIATSPASVVFPHNNQNFNEIFNAAFKADYNRQLFNQLYRYESSNPRNVNGARANFAASIPYKESSYSEPDPYYHGQYSATPYSLIPKSVDTSTLVSQLPYDYGSDGSVLTSTESHHVQKVTTIESDELSQTTPFSSDDTPSTIQNKYYHSSEYFDQNNNPNQQYDSINAQLPAPETGTIASSYASAVEQGRVYLNRNDEIQTEVNSFAPTDSNSDPTTMESQVTTRRADETTIKTLTEKTSWKPKRLRYKQSEKVKEQKVERNPVTVKKKQSSGNRKRKVNHEKSSTQKLVKGGESVNSTSTTTKTTIKSTTAASNRDEEEPITKQSVHKTVSVHIGEKITVLPNSEKETNNEVRGSTKYKSKIIKVKKV